MTTSAKRIIVTGAASGIGAACVRAALDRGWSVCAVDINEPDATGIPANARARFLAARADVADAAACEAAVANANLAQNVHVEGFACASGGTETPLPCATTAS